MLRLLSAAALLVVLAAGCGGAGRSERVTHGVPRALAQGWEDRAEAIAVAASAGNDCHAQQLAVSLRADVEKSEQKVPRRLRSPLLNGVKALEARITCTPPATTVPQKPPKQPKPPHEKHGDHEHDHGHHGHGKGGDGGGDQ